MKLNKYSVASDRGSAIGSYSSTKKTTTSSTSSITSLDRNIWGQEDDGSDIDGDLTCGGNLYVIDNYIDDEDDENDEYSSKVKIEIPVPLADEGLEDKFNNNDGGNLYVKRELVVDEKGSFKAAEYQSGYNLPANDNSSKFASTEWIKNNHKVLSFKDTKGKELGEFDNSDDVTVVIKNYDDEITEVKNSIPTKVSKLDNDEGYITAEDIPELPEIDKNAPVILFSGIIHSNNNDGSLTYQPWVVRPLCYAQHTGVNNIELDYLTVGGEKKCTLVVKVNAKEGWYVKPTSMHSTVSLDSHCNPAVDFGGNRRSQGYWTTGGLFPTGDMYIQVWRTEDANNDSTMNDQVAYSAQEINLTIFGLSYKIS